jgi:hypothetical protein
VFSKITLETQCLERLSTQESRGIPVATILEMVQYGVGGGLLSLVLSFVLMMVFYHTSPRDVLDQIENKDNGAIGAAFFVVSLLGGLAVSFWIYQPVAGGLGFDVAALWLLVALVIGGLLYNVLSLPLLAYMCRDNTPRENPWVFQRRELFVDKNVGLALFTGGILVSVMAPCLASALSA